MIVSQKPARQQGQPPISLSSVVLLALPNRPTPAEMLGWGTRGWASDTGLSISAIQTLAYPIESFYMCPSSTRCAQNRRSHRRRPASPQVSPAETSL